MAIRIVIEMYIPFVKLKRIIGVDPNMARDPVCKMSVDEKTAKLKSEHKGKTYFFCAPGCKKAFEEAPEKYLK
jgi:YHS domain-containing protein